MTAGVVEYRHATPAEALAVIDELKAVYAVVFAEPPYNEGPEMADKFVGWVREESKKPGFDMVLGYSEGRLVGFAYGHTMPAGKWWRGADRPGPPEAVAAEKFAVMEWAVLPERRGGGVGRRLMDGLLAGRREPFGVLTVHPTAPARALYARLGWAHVGSTGRGGAPGMDIMISRLR